MNGKIKSLDGIRAIAVFLVIIAHATGIYYHEYEASLGGISQFGVWLFFVLSAFLLTNRFVTTGFSWRSLLSYILGRSMRILPVFAIAVLVYSYFGYFDLNMAYSIITMKEAALHFWTIPIEYKFYYILPFIAFAGIYLGKISNWNISALLLAVSAIVFNILSPNVMWYIPIFLFGMSAAFLYQKKSLNFGGKFYDLIFIFFLLSVIFALPKVMHMITGSYSDGWVLNKFVFYSPIFALVILMMSYGEGFFAKILSSPVLSYIGKWSFSIYLWHFLILAMGVWFVGMNFYMYIFTMIASVFVGAISFYLIENPMEKLRHKIMSMITSKRISDKAIGKEA
ncbi:acyltransferase [Citrobacter sp. Cf088]|uniref:acyltransferase family protein n=1 Tax=Citrobacter sp. Cf088 TaxID=2985055 RepID=UPI002574C533|nr:acyltransferase [Citrobacter sp. Cf088]MDM3222498.1 acyltransferase [Citrobacter sp. Cf088]